MVLDGTDRGQAFTLEGIVAGLLVVIALLFAMQGVAVTPGAPGADVEPELRQQAVDLLDLAAADGSLDEQLRLWDDENGTFEGAVDDTEGYGTTVPDTAFGELINQTFTERGKVVNVVVEYAAADRPGSATEPLIYRGEPPSASTVATTTITLYSDQPLTSEGGEDTTLAEADTYPFANVDPDGPVHNVVTVRVVVW